MTASLGEFQKSVDDALAEIKADQVIERIWAHDHTVWKPEPSEITNRLGWLRIAEKMEASLPELDDLVSSLREEGYSQALLLGMGGSSLAPEVFRKTFGVRDGFLDLAILDSTDPGAIHDQAKKLDLKKTAFIVATKSGGTVETLSFFKYFYNQVVEALGAVEAGNHFIAITDAGSKLDEIASQCNFRATFRNDRNIGGRYSALSYFGLLPAALIGVDLDKLLGRAQDMARKNMGNDLPDEGSNYGAHLGAILGELANAGRDKLTLVTSAQIASFGDWVEQLIAESTGKEGKGILPVVGEPIGAPENYGDDRLFIFLTLDDDPSLEEKFAGLKNAGHPVVKIRISDLYDLGGQFFLWEMATAVAGYRLGINPFDQPNVEEAKVLAKEMMSAYRESGTLPELKVTMKFNGVSVFGDEKLPSADLNSPNEALQVFLEDAHPGSYISIQAYIKPTVEAEKALQEFRAELRDRTRLATTVGYGPRFLHSTGQLHKGDAGKGYFIQLTSDSPQDIPIPDEPGSNRSSISFGVLKGAQALGDRQALLDTNRRVLRFHLGTDVLGGLDKLTTD
jgi:transaldolase/glucose-6-phosphate isomerase